MNYKSVTNDKGLTCELVKIHEVSDYDPFMGGDDNNPTWEQYLDMFKEEYKGHVLLIRQIIIDNELVGETGQFADDLVFKFSDGQCWGYTWRAWGDLMQAIVDKQEGYIKYYM